MAEPGIANNGLFCTTSLETESGYGTSTTCNKKRPELSACGPFTDELGLEFDADVQQQNNQRDHQRRYQP
jgi:hypothetical protein